MLCVRVFLWKFEAFLRKKLFKIAFNFNYLANFTNLNYTKRSKAFDYENY